MMMGFRWEIIQDYLPLFIEGALTTVKCTITCIILGLLWGLLLGLGRVASAPNGFWKYTLYFGVKFPVKIYVSAFRGTPLFVQLMVVYFVLMPYLFNPQHGLLVNLELMSPETARLLRSHYGGFIASVVAITLNSGAYISEIVRAGIQSIDKGQMEAARSLGMSYLQTMQKVILPQAFYKMLPALGNNAIAILKDSSLGASIGLADLAFAARTAGAAYASYDEPYLIISLVYWCMTCFLSALIHLMEKTLGHRNSYS